MEFSRLFEIFWLIAAVVQVLAVGISNELEFKLIGQYLFLPYERFRGLPEGICSNLTSLHLAYLEFDPNNLIKSLEGCDELKRIKLDQVEFLNPVTRTVRLPKLERFVLRMYPIQANTAEEFMDHLFFFNNSAGETIPETVTNIILQSWSGKANDELRLSYRSGSIQELSVYKMKYNVTKYFNYQVFGFVNSFVDHKSIKVNNLTSLTLWSADYEDGIFEVLKSAYSLRRLIIRNKDKVNLRSIDISIFPLIENFTYLYIENADIWSSKWVQLRELGSLELINCEFNITLISVSSFVNYLIFKRVNLIGDELNTFLSRLNNIESVALDYTGIPGQNFDLTSLGNSLDVLSKLTFSGMQIQIPSKHFQFFKVKTLSFIECAFDENIVTEFNSIFPKIDHVVLYQNNLSYSMFQGILNSSVSSVYFKPRKFEVPEITKFLQDSGFPSGDLVYPLVKSKNSTTGWITDDNSGSTMYTPGLTNTVLYAYILLLMGICGFGLLGSFISSIVLTRKNMWGSTSCILLGLTFCDSLVLLTYICSVLYFGIKLILVFLEQRVSDSQVNQILGLEITESSVTKLDELQYSILYPLNKTAYTGSVYATVLLTIERYVAVCWPLHVRQFLRTRVAVTSIFIVLGSSIILNFPRWIEAHQYYSDIYFAHHWGSPLHGKRLIFNRITHASGLLRNRLYRQYYHVWIWVTFMYILPISGLTILNFLILKQLRKSNQARKALAATTNQRNNAVNQEEIQLASLTKMLLSVIMIFILCNSVSGCIAWAFIVRGWDPMDIEIFSCIPLIINSSINFIIYVLLGSKFRAELCNLITRLWNVIYCPWNRSRGRSELPGNEIPIPLVQFPLSATLR